MPDAPDIVRKTKQLVSGQKRVPLTNLRGLALSALQGLEGSYVPGPLDQNVFSAL